MVNCFYWRQLRAFILVVALLGISKAASIPAPASFVRVEGTELIAPSGEPLLLRGINLGNWLVQEGYLFDLKGVASAKQIETLVAECIGDMAAARFWHDWRESYITHEDIRLIKQLGFNSVRVPLNWRLFATEDYAHRFSGEGWRLLDQMVAWCQQEKLWVILDLHCAPGGQTGDNIDDSRGRPQLFEDEDAQRLTVALWSELASRYRDDPTILGYDLLNEPIAPYFDVKALNPRLAPLYTRITRAIRDVDRNHIVILGGAQRDTQLPAAKVEGDDNVLYTFHLYQDAPILASIQKYLNFRNDTHVPIWLGESGENTDVWVSDFRSLLEDQRIGWCFWPYKKLSKPSCVVTVTAPAHWDEINAYAKVPKASFKHIRETLPPLANAQEAFRQLIENIKLPRATINHGYVSALGLNPPASSAP